MEINYIHEPTFLQCGQTVLAMLTAKTVEEIIRICGNDKETNLKEMRELLKIHGYTLSNTKESISRLEDLPSIALLSLETPLCWHWSLYVKGKVYDPYYGVLRQLPQCNRKFYWEIKTSG